MLLALLRLLLPLRILRHAPARLALSGLRLVPRGCLHLGRLLRQLPLCLLLRDAVPLTHPLPLRRLFLCGKLCPRVALMVQKRGLPGPLQRGEEHHANLSQGR